MSSKLTTLQQLKAEAQKAHGLAASVAATAAQAIEEEVNAAKGSAVPFTIPANGWIESEPDGSATEDEALSAYPFYYDLTVAGVTTKDRADVTVSLASMETATACGFCSVTETLTNKIRVRAVSRPSGGITAQYWIFQGKE